MHKSLKSYYVAFTIILMIACTQAIRYKSIKTDGKALSKIYCSNCLAYPDPSSLPRKIWVNGVLPEMGLRLGMSDRSELLKKYQFKLYDQLIQLGVYPENPIIKENEWDAIVSYYTHNSPIELLDHTQKENDKEGNHQFSFIEINTPTNQSATTTSVNFNQNKKEIWIGNHQRTVDRYDLTGKLIHSFRTPSPVVDLINQQQPIFLSIGNMQPNEDKNGRLFSMNEYGAKGKLLVDTLHRPAQVIQADMDKDGYNDFIIAEFGYITGQVKLFNTQNWKHYIISKMPGARNMHVRDINKDGLPDLIVLFTQAWESISVFINKGNSQYQEKKLISFPAAFGSSFLELADINGDGLEDFLLSNGDNADYSICRKNYHGVRIFLNQQNSNYKESWFYPLPGATKTIAKDFDGDGDQDLAAIAYFSDVKDQSNFIYFENKGNMKMLAWDLPIPDARWLVMESGDMEGDGDQELILGNFIDAQDTTVQQAKNIQALILKNNFVKPK